MQWLGLASHTFLHLGAGEAPALATAVVVQQTIEETLFFFNVHRS